MAARSKYNVQQRLDGAGKSDYTPTRSSRTANPYRKTSRTRIVCRICIWYGRVCKMRQYGTTRYGMLVCNPGGKLPDIGAKRVAHGSSFG